MAFEGAVSLPKEQVAFLVVDLYLREGVRGKLKRGLEFDDVLEVYFYALGRLWRSDEELSKLNSAIVAAEERLDSLEKDVLPTVNESEDSLID